MVSIEYALVVLLFLALIFDIRTEKVPNSLILVGYAAGAINFVMWYGAIGFLLSILSVFVVWICLMPVFLYGGLGGGDCKLLAWIVLFFRTECLTECYFMIFLCGAVIALYKKFIRGRRTFHFTMAAFAGVLLSIIKFKL